MHNTNKNKYPQIVVDTSLNNRIIEDRTNALADTLTENMPWKEKLYTLKPGAKELLRKQDINKVHYEVCYGNEIQQQLHGEFVTIVNKASEIRNATDSDVIQFITSMSEVGLSATHNGNIEQATTLANACWTFLDYGKAIAMGAFEGIVLDQVDMVVHPVQTIKNVGGLLCNVGYYFGKAIYEYGHLSYLSFTDPEAAHKKIEAWHENAKKLANALYDQYQNSSGTDLARGTTRLVTGAVFGPKVTGAVIKMLKKLPGKIAEKAAEVVRVLQEEEHIHVTPEGIKVPAPSQNMNLMGKAKNTVDKAKNNAKRFTREVVKLTSKEAKKAAKKLGFEKTNYYSKQQPVFKKGKYYITPDIDAHSGGTWKMAKKPEYLYREGKRLGTYDANLNWIGE